MLKGKEMIPTRKEALRIGKVATFLKHRFYRKWGHKPYSSQAIGLQQIECSDVLQIFKIYEAIKAKELDNANNS